MLTTRKQATDNEERARLALEELARLEEPDARADLFRSTPVGPGTTHGADEWAGPPPDETAARARRARDTGAGIINPSELEGEPGGRVISIPEPEPIRARPGAAAPVEDGEPGIDDPEGTRAALEALLAEQRGGTARDAGAGIINPAEAAARRSPLEGLLEDAPPRAPARPEDSVLRSDQMQGADDPMREDVFGQAPEGGYEAADRALAAAMREAPDREMYGLATDADPELPGRIRSASPLDALLEPGGGRGLADPRVPPRSAAPAPPSSSVVAERGGSPPPAPESAEESAARRAARISALQQMIDGIAQVGSAMSGGTGFVGRARTSTPDLMSAAATEDATAARGDAAERQAAREAARLATSERIASMRAEREPTEVELAREERLRADAERRAALSDRSLDLREREVGSRITRAADTAARATARGTAGSEESARARARLRALAEGLPAEVRDVIADDLASEEWTAEDVERMERAGPSWWRALLTRRPRGSGGGGGETRAALRAGLMSSGRASTEEEAEAMIDALGLSGARGEYREALGARPAGRGGPTEGPVMLVEGVYAPAEAGVRDVEARNFRRGWGEVRTRLDALRELEGISRRYGPEAAINPRIIGEIEPHLMRLRGMAAAVQGSGIINPSEMPAINAALPDATSLAGMTFGRLSGALRGWRTEVEGGIRHQLEDLGVPEEEVTRAMRALRSGARVRDREREREEAADETVRVRGPDGTVRRVPASSVPAEGLPEGYTLAE